MTKKNFFPKKVIRKSGPRNFFRSHPNSAPSLRPYDKAIPVLNGIKKNEDSHSVLIEVLLYKCWSKIRKTHNYLQ